MKQQSLIKLVKSEVPMEFLTSWTCSLDNVYQETKSHTSSYYADHVAEDILPYIRRAKAEELLCNTANQYKIKVSIEKNSAKNWNYTQVRSGKILMTTSYVDAPNKIVRAARFRETLAENQYKLFIPIDDQEGDSYYAILLHGGLAQSYFARIAFPSPDCQRYIENIDLFKFCNINKISITSSEEKIKDESTPQLRAKVYNKKAWLKLG